MEWKVDRLNFAPSANDEVLRVESIEAVHKNGDRRTLAGDYFFSTMPMRELIRAMDLPVPANVREVSDGLQYRDFITVGCSPTAEGEGAGRRFAEGHVDLHPGARCATGRYRFSTTGAHTW